MSEFIPFSANGVGAAIAHFGLALIARGGLIALIGWIVVARQASRPAARCEHASGRSAGLAERDDVRYQFVQLALAHVLLVERRHGPSPCRT